MLDREAFISAIRAEPDAIVHRRAFADWLDEHDCPEEADFHRRWTPEAYAESVAYLNDYSERLCRHERYGKYLAPGEEPESDDLVPFLTYDELIAAADRYLDTGTSTCLPFDTPDYTWSERGKFWEAFQTVTGRQVTEEQADDRIFRCAC
jgi:uncharacterized protein (TIGR02996 family)